MWGAQFVSNTGSWMQTVAAQCLMLTLTSSATYVALVQTTAGLPVVLLAVLAGTIGDLVDRRRFLLITQALMLIAATALGAVNQNLARAVGPGYRRHHPGGDQCRHRLPGQRRNVRRRHRGDRGVAFHPREHAPT